VNRCNLVFIRVIKTAEDFDNGLNLGFLTAKGEVLKTAVCFYYTFLQKHNQTAKQVFPKSLPEEPGFRKILHPTRYCI